MTRAQYVSQCAELLRLPLAIANEETVRAERIATVLGQLGVRTRAHHCRKCGRAQPLAGLSADGLCFAHALAERASQMSDDDCVCWATRQRLIDDSEPILSGDRDTRGTDRCGPPDKET